MPETENSPKKIIVRTKVRRQFLAPKNNGFTLDRGPPVSMSSMAYVRFKRLTGASEASDDTWVGVPEPEPDILDTSNINPFTTKRIDRKIIFFSKNEKLHRSADIFRAGIFGGKIPRFQGFALVILERKTLRLRRLFRSNSRGS